ncbi:hypothetical protein VTL71DRAFT_5819 [Oculimacula yallundae]|uniref:Alcohol dehydrogenase n=1 Tax=Oculimacula yallundae TaxID=86028 RepID=A0ABR4BZL2_9HELO
MNSSVDSSLAGCYVAAPVRFMVYGRGSVLKSLPDIISKLRGSKALIVTGKTLSTKTPVIKDIESLLGSTHVGTFNEIGQHAPIGAIRTATKVALDAAVDILISVGGGSPIDSAKAMVYQIHEQTGIWIPSIAIPTTLSVAETTQNAGFTTEEKKKIAVSHPELVPKAVIYDGDIAVYTPIKLWTSTGIRALDHAVELLYHPLASEIPTKRLALEAVRELFTYLPLSLDNPQDADIRQKLLLACYSSLFPFLYTGGVGLSHSLGHSLGASYNIPHGITSCLTLAPVIGYKSNTNEDESKMIARVLPYIGIVGTPSVTDNAKLVSAAIEKLVTQLGHRSTLTMYGVPAEDEEEIVSHALQGGKSHPDFDAVKSIVHKLY